MREIKFRAWLKEKKVMAEFISHFKSAHDCGVFEITVPFDESGLQTFHKIHSIDQFDLMQYTGLKDKNGKEIYEGDILGFNYKDTSDGDEWIVEVEVKWGDQGWVPYRLYEGTVIGNIYENPELLGNKPTV